MSFASLSDSKEGDLVVQCTVRNWGNSLGIRLQKVVAEHLKLHTGSRVDIYVEDGRIVITPSSSPSLDDLLGQITPQNLHGETDFGKPIGNEIW